jgi:hypothetical protein
LLKPKNINSKNIKQTIMKIPRDLRKKKATSEKEEQKEVEYQPLGENAYHIKATIDNERFDIISYGFPQDKKEDSKKAGELSTQGVKVENEKDKQVRGSWDAVVKTEKYGYLPLETWKKISHTVAGTLSVATGSHVTSSDVTVYATTPVNSISQCPKCGSPVYINLGTCPKCGTTL